MTLEFQKSSKGLRVYAVMGRVLSRNMKGDSIFEQPLMDQKVVLGGMALSMSSQGQRYHMEFFEPEGLVAYDAERHGSFR